MYITIPNNEFSINTRYSFKIFFFENSTIRLNEFEKINQNNFNYSFMTIYFAYLVCN